MLEFRVLGPLEVWDGDRAVPLGGRKQRSVLAMLVLSANRFIGTDALIDGVWGEETGEKAGATLQVYVSNLRRALAADASERASTIIGRPGGYQLPAEPDQVDLLRFHALAAEGRRLLEGGRYASAAGPLVAAQRLWRGAALGDLGFEPFAAGVVDQLEESRSALVADRIEVDLALGRHGEVVVELEELVARHPLHERHWAQLMLALYRDGRQADALRAFGRARDVLVEELGLDPGPDLQDLERRILDQDPTLVTAPPSAGAVAPVPPERPLRLPVPGSTLVGRSHELAEVVALLGREEVRLLTLTGPGGVGKTRLALAAASAAEAEGAFAGGVAFAGLAAVDDPDRVLGEVARALGLPESGDPGPAGDIAAHLGAEPSLLVLDNLEQLAHVDRPVAELMDAAPALTILATSRIPVHLSGEHEYPVPPLTVPPDGRVALDQIARSEAVTLFVERSRALVPTFELTPTNAGDIGRICARLDGLPLALELAAARVKLLAPADLLTRLDDSLHMLVGGRADLPQRQRTIRATLEWSYALLEPPLQHLLDRLGVFAAPFTLESAEAVCGSDEDVPVLEGLGHLVDNSLVRTISDGGVVRFRLLQTVRDYSRERLDERGEGPRLRRLHAAHLVATCEAAAARLDGIEGPARLEELTVGEPDQRAAFAFALADGDPDTAGRIAVALRPYWVAQGRLHDGRAWLDEVLADPGLSDEVRARALVAAGILAYYQDDHDRSAALLQQGLDACRGMGDIGSTATALSFLGISVLTGGSPEAAGPLAEEALELSRDAGLYETHAMALSLSAMLAALGGDGAREKELYEERLKLARAHQDRTRIADTLNTMAEISLDEGELEAARAFATEALGRARGTAKLTTRDSLLTIGRVALADRDATGASAAFAEALDLCVEFEQPFELAQCLRGIASTASLAGDMGRAARLFGAAAQAHAVPTDSPFPLEQDLADHRDAARDALGEEAFDAAWRAGELLDLGGAVALARSSSS